MSCTNSSNINSSANETRSKTTPQKKKYSFGDCTRGESAIPLNDGGYIITGYVLDKMKKDNFDSLVFDKRSGFILRVDSNLEKRWLFVNEQRYNNEISSALQINDSIFACFSSIYNKKVKALNTVSVLFFNLKGKIVGEETILVTKKESYFNNGAILASDSSIILYGQVTSFEPKVDYYFVLHKLNTQGKILKTINVSIPKQLASECYMLTSSDGNLFFAGASCDFKDMKLIKMTTDFKTIWEKTIAIGFEPLLKETKTGGVIVTYKDIENGNDFVTKTQEFDKDGNSLWENEQNNFVAKYITQTNDNSYILLSPARNDQISISKMSAKGIIQSDKKVRLDSLQYPSYMYQTKSGKIFIVGQELNGAFDSYDRKMVLLYANENQ
ncbi:MAG: hypothetical protein JNJ41_12275 [Bacteroidia bacterium]|nr:hypothetical protein [Bacteroidia bacterium]